MPTPIITEGIAGPFTADWQTGLAGGSHSTTANLGITSKGFRMIRRYETEEVPADLVGLSVVDAVHLGAQLFLELELEEANLLAVQQISAPFTVPASETLANRWADEGELGIPGAYYTDKGGSLLLTPAYSTNNSAGAASTPVFNFGVVTLAPGFELNQLLASRRRIVPLRLRCYPYLDSSRYVFFTKAALS